MLTDNWKSMLAFGGYAAKTVVYCLLGVLTLQSAIGAYGSDSPSQKKNTVFENTENVLISQNSTK